uniref:Solute carrier family 6 member 4 n=1 Tax=Meloidogyne hapla TaxID=6305 RepID=A0A1I8BBQ2_MELHA
PRYLANQNSGVTVEFLMPAIISATGGFVVILLNFSVCYITVKYR